MLEAKDTVMSLEEYNRFTLELYRTRNWRNYCKADCLDHEFKADLEHQAEISFKAGEDSKLKEVKEWRIEACPHVSNPNYFKPKHICEMCWQAFLEEKGDKK